MPFFLSETLISHRFLKSLATALSEKGTGLEANVPSTEGTSWALKIYIKDLETGAYVHLQKNKSHRLNINEVHGDIGYISKALIAQGIQPF